MPKFLHAIHHLCFHARQNWDNRIREAFGQDFFLPDEVITGNTSTCLRPSSCTQLSNWSVKLSVVNHIFCILSFLYLRFFPLFSWVSSLGNCIFSSSYYRGTMEWKSHSYFSLTHSLNTINFSFDAFFLSALITLPQEMRTNKSSTRVEEQGTDQILYNDIL